MLWKAWDSFLPGGEKLAQGSGWALLGCPFLTTSAASPHGEPERGQERGRADQRKGHGETAVPRTEPDLSKDGFVLCSCLQEKATLSVGRKKLSRKNPF